MTGLMERYVDERIETVMADLRAELARVASQIDPRIADMVQPLGSRLAAVESDMNVAFEHIDTFTPRLDQVDSLARAALPRAEAERRFDAVSTKVATFERAITEFVEGKRVSDALQAKIGRAIDELQAHVQAQARRGNKTIETIVTPPPARAAMSVAAPTLPPLEPSPSRRRTPSPVTPPPAPSNGRQRVRNGQYVGDV